MENNGNNYKEWIHFASNDLKAAKILFANNPNLSNVIMFECQQTVEKIIKAVLSIENIKFGKIHDLDKLLSYIEDKPWFSASLYSDIEIFEKYSVEVRYPDGEVIPTTDELIHALRIAEGIFPFLSEKLPKQ